MTININELLNINRALNDYVQRVEGDVQKAAQDTARLGARTLKKSSAGTFKNRDGDYRRGWRAKKVRGGNWVVYNATDYQLTHLLEKGHEIKNGDGNTYGNARAFPHIQPVEQELIEEFVRKVESAINGN